MKKQLKTITSILLFGIFIFMGISSGEESKNNDDGSGGSQTEEVDQKLILGALILWMPITKFSLNRLVVIGFIKNH